MDGGKKMWWIEFAIGLDFVGCVRHRKAMSCSLAKAKTKNRQRLKLDDKIIHVLSYR